MCTVHLHIYIYILMCGWYPKQYLGNVTSQMSDFLSSGSMQMARCCNHRCHKQGQTGSQHLSLSFPLKHTLCGTKWSATLNNSLRYRVAAGIYLSALGSSRVLSLVLAGSKSNKQEDKWRARSKKGTKKRTQRKTNQPLQSGEEIHTKWLQKGSNKAARESSLWLSISLLPSLPLPLLSQSKFPFFKAIPSFSSHSPWSPLCSFQLFPPYCTKHILYRSCDKRHLNWLCYTFLATFDIKNNLRTWIFMWFYCLFIYGPHYAAVLPGCVGAGGLADS